MVRPSAGGSGSAAPRQVKAVWGKNQFAFFKNYQLMLDFDK